MEAQPSYLQALSDESKDFMETSHVKVLLIDDDPDDYIITRDLLSDIEGIKYELDWEAEYDEGLNKIGPGQHDVYLVDYRLGEHTGIELLKEAIANGCKAPMILLTGQGYHELDLEAMKSGAMDYLAKNQIDSTLLERSIRYSIERKKAEVALIEANENLELHVKVRTGELAKANESLKAEIVERERIQEDLITAKELAEAANRAKSEFLANMSHEIRTPMNGVIGMTQLALETDLSEEQSHYLTTSVRSAETLLKIINDILDFSKIEAKKLEFDPIDFGLRQSITDVIELMGRSSGDKGLQIFSDVEADIPDALYGDSGRLRQIILNLMGNAIKFTASGKVELRVKLDSRTNERIVLRFEVEDTGIGIPEERQESIFEAFSQVDGSTTRKYGGTGLGLAICAQLVEMMQGRIWVESKLGSGSCFKFTTCLERARNGTSVSQPHPSDESIANGQIATQQAKEQTALRILLAEDNVVNQEVARIILSKKGHTVIPVCDGKQAVEMYQSDRFDIVLMDVQMPEMDGFEATYAIRAIEGASGKHVPIVAMTANAMQGDRELCINSGMDDYIAKPINAKELLRIIEGFAPSAEHNHDSQAKRSEAVSPVDWGEAMENLEGDSALLIRLIGLFLQDSDRLMAELVQAIETCDGEKLGRVAHTLKGASSNISATAINLLAKSIEAHVQAEDFESAGRHIPELQNEIGLLSSLLEQKSEEPSYAYINSGR